MFCRSLSCIGAFPAPLAPVEVVVVPAVDPVVPPVVVVVDPVVPEDWEGRAAAVTGLCCWSLLDPLVPGEDWTLRGLEHIIIYYSDEVNTSYYGPQSIFF